MGLISIETKGSFEKSFKTFSAEKKGHAHAINGAMAYLAGLMRESINNDHRCHDEGIRPSEGFHADYPVV